MSEPAEPQTGSAGWQLIELKPCCMTAATPTGEWSCPRLVFRHDLGHKHCCKLCQRSGGFSHTYTCNHNQQCAFAFQKTGGFWNLLGRIRLRACLSCFWGFLHKKHVRREPEAEPPARREPAWGRPGLLVGPATRASHRRRRTRDAAMAGGLGCVARAAV